MIQKLWFWLAYSSENPQKVSLTLKAGIPFLLVVFGWFGVASPELEGMLDSGATALVNLVALVYASIEGVRAFFGICRKLYNTVKQETA